MLQSLNGCWYVIYTNFDMWKHDKVSHVTFNYTLVERNGQLCLLDEVNYLKKGKKSAIKGYDFLDAHDSSKLIWQGRGWMFWIKCPWKVEWINEAQTCIILTFEKTVLSTGGLDVVTRDSNPAQAILDEAATVIEGNSNLRNKSRNSIRVLQH